MGLITQLRSEEFAGCSEKFNRTTLMQAISDQLSILVIEDNPADLFLINDMLCNSGLPIREVHTAARISDALEILKNNDTSLVLLDLSLPDSFGINSFLKLRAETLKIPVIILTGLSESDIALETLKHGAQDYLVKGEFKSELLVKCIQYSIERKSAEEKILESEEKYRQMFYKNPFPGWIYDLKTLQILEVNEAAKQKYGYTKEEFLNLTIDDIRATADTDEWSDLIGNEIIKDKIHSRFVQHKKKNGQTVIAEITYFQINYFGKIAMQAQINDVTEKLRLEKELLEQHAIKQRQITEAVLSAQEKERKIIGAELHDNINQILATAKLYYGAVADNAENAKAMIAKGDEYISMAIQEIRKLSRDLVTPPFIESGLKHAISELAENIVITRRIKVKINLDDFEENDLSTEFKINMYRIIQEQLNNTLKHADASVIAININGTDDKINLEIIDNGVGFDTNTHSEGIGMTNIQTRAGLFNGKMEIVSSPGKGCKMNIELYPKTLRPQKAA
jgi:two-component system, NarL family, sensor histidine kinase UhpB